MCFFDRVSIEYTLRFGSGLAVVRKPKSERKLERQVSQVSFAAAAEERDEANQPGASCSALAEPAAPYAEKDPLSASPN